MKVDWRDIDQIIKIIEKDEHAGYHVIGRRYEMVRHRLRKEIRTNKSIHYFGGDFIAESYGEYPEFENLPEMELTVLKDALERGADVKVLARFDPSSPKLLRVIGRYVDEEIPIRKWSGDIRGGIYEGIKDVINVDGEDRTVLYDSMYVLQRQLAIAPSELTLEMVEKLPQKTVGEPQRDEDVKMDAVVTNSKSLIRKFKKEFNHEWKNSTPMEYELKRIEGIVENNNKTEALS